MFRKRLEKSDPEALTVTHQRLDCGYPASLASVPLGVRVSAFTIATAAKIWQLHQPCRFGGQAPDGCERKGNGRSILSYVAQHHANRPDGKSGRKRAWRATRDNTLTSISSASLTAATTETKTPPGDEDAARRRTAREEVEALDSADPPENDNTPGPSLSKTPFRLSAPKNSVMPCTEGDDQSRNAKSVT
ncbi:hypothetical protein CH63R_07079 [Colletotrichum higginsianum IMI 349063]|uniref:Uncharacterized protein n=1 Tax=Colletotrichum higginsianum (strain IMI 349063) TaxID=759273 RepID=A0A1B7Y8I4_COLHI|nr:hypothetical protein CH63R_07079 [Colletotrichum higginsianum IMI 349063]OBR08314.1 hypothetical protein CH63R_07079 [Colletotrichum higginsianum IMI 349063]